MGPILVTKSKDFGAKGNAQLQLTENTGSLIEILGKAATRITDNYLLA
eukprot:COSAG01_NODE_15596_length_1320_cov_27.398034_2_plen_48_part_00